MASGRRKSGLTAGPSTGEHTTETYRRGEGQTPLRTSRYGNDRPDIKDTLDGMGAPVSDQLPAMRVENSGFDPLRSTSHRPWFDGGRGATPEMPQEGIPDDLPAGIKAHPMTRPTVPVSPKSGAAGARSHRRKSDLSRTYVAQLGQDTVGSTIQPLTNERVARVLKNHERVSHVDVDHLATAGREELLRVLRIVLEDGEETASLANDLLQAHQREGRKLKRAWRCDVTGGLNKTGYMALVNAAFDRCMANNVPVSLAILDLNFLKAVNDNLGEKYGDVILKLVHDTIITELQRAGLSIYSEDNKEEGSVLVSKYGGDEYGVFLPGMELEEAAELAEKIRKAVEYANYEVDMPRGYEGMAPSTINGAVLQAEPNCPNYKDLHKRAAALHAKAKKEDGRNIIVRGAAEYEEGNKYVMVTPEDRYEPQTPERYTTSNANSLDLNGLPMSLKRMVRGGVHMIIGVYHFFAGDKKPKKALEKPEEK